MFSVGIERDGPKYFIALSDVLGFSWLGIFSRTLSIATSESFWTKPFVHHNKFTFI